MAQITYTNKVALNENPEIADINKVTDDDMNEIKQVVNDNYNNTIQITSTEPTDSDNKIWIDTGEAGSAPSEITNEYSTSTGIGYSANYVNKLMVGTVLFNGDDRTASITLNDSVANYDKIEIIYKGNPGVNILNSVSIENPNNTKVQLIIDAEASGNNTITLLVEWATLSGTTLTINKRYRCILQNNSYPNIGELSDTSYYYMSILKVIGYKYEEE